MKRIVGLGFRGLREDFAEAQLFAIWANKVVEARAIFRRHYDRNATKTTTGRKVVCNMRERETMERVGTSRLRGARAWPVLRRVNLF